MPSYPGAAINNVYSTSHTTNAWIRFTPVAVPPATPTPVWKKIDETSTDGVTNILTAASAAVITTFSARVETDATDQFIVAIYVPSFP